MKSKRDARLKRARKSRSKIRELLVPRLCVYRSPRHTYAQIISEDGAQVKVAASTLESALRDGPTGNIEGAAKVGALIAERAKAAGFERVAFDRSG
ncbi:50S ribosomal protein L18, partial [Pseudomonadales bacterium]|nr:50S ribosomal protein L18 [Pseudomonadales bacterium]